MFVVFLKSDLRLIHGWSLKWKMIYNPNINKPVEKVIFTNRNATS